MLKSELYEIILNGENSGVEFKCDDIRPEQLAKQVVAFANAHGGRIFLGIGDNGQVTGLTRTKPQEWVFNAVRDKVHPLIIPYYEEIVCEDGKRVAVVTIPAGISKPYVLRHNNREEIYIRMGDRVELASREQQARLFQSGAMLHVEVLPIAGTSIKSLDLPRLDYYLREIIKDPDMPGSEEEWSNRLMGLGLMADDGLGLRVCTIAGLLSFGIGPRRYFRQAGLRVMVFDSQDKEYTATVDTVLDGPLAPRGSITETGQSILVEGGLVEKFSSLILPFVSREAGEVDDRMRREKVWLYPWEAIREAVINALAHRDWTRSVDIEVSVYSNRMEIISPGNLQNSMTVDKMIAGQRSPRNPLLVEILRDCGYVDARGMGVRTKIIPLMLKHNKAAPVFEATEDYLKIILPRAAQDTEGS